MAARATVFSKPIASSTWLVPTLPDEHAAPALTRNLREVERDHQCLRARTGEPDVRRVGQASSFRADHDGIRRDRADLAFQPVAQRGYLFHTCKIALCRLGRCAEPGDGRYVFGSSAAAALLATAGNKGRKACALVNHQRADAFRPADLVGGQRQIIHAERAQIDRDAAGGLHGVGVDEECLAPWPRLPPRPPAG